MKVLDVNGLYHGIDEILTTLASRQKQIMILEGAIEGVASLDHALKSEAGNAIRSFFQEYHLPFIKLLNSFLSDYQIKLKELKVTLAMLEPDQNGFIRQETLEDEVDYGLNTARMITIALTNETNLLVESIADIVELPKIQDNQFLDAVNEAKTSRNRTIDRLNEYDFQQASSFESLEQDAILMKQYIEKMRTMFMSGDLSIVNQSNNTLNDQPIYQQLLTATR